MGDSLERLYKSVIALQKGDPSQSRTARLIRSGRPKIAKKMAEEAVEVVIDALNGNREAVVRESADLLYHLVVLWAEAGIRPQEVWAEMDRREKLLGLAEKLPKELPKHLPKGLHRDTHRDPNKGALSDAGPQRKVVALEARRIPKRRPSGY
jgi:phosphoribosyl-ATP pyrophosphohydrolase